ncbi:MAG: DUF2975 domain-containing protein [Nocardioides sp.]
MSLWVERLLRAVLVVALAGSVGLQGALVIGAVLNDHRTVPGVVAAAIVFLGVVALQVTAVCIWRLLTMVRRGTVFSHAAFRYVDIVIGAVAAASALVFALAVDARFVPHEKPDDGVAPGVVGLVCGVALVLAGVALVIYVLRVLLAQAVTLDSETRRLQAQLDEVI